MIGRIDIAIAELGADHLVALALFNVGNAQPASSRVRLPFRRIVADVRPPHRCAIPPADGRIARGADIAVADLPPLDLVRREKLRSTPALQRRGELPAEIDGIADAGIHPETAGRNDEMHGVAGEEDAAVSDSGRQAAGSAATGCTTASRISPERRRPSRTASSSSSSVSTVACSVQCFVESCMIRKVALSSAT